MEHSFSRLLINIYFDDKLKKKFNLKKKNKRTLDYTQKHKLYIMHL